MFCIRGFSIGLSVFSVFIAWLGRALPPVRGHSSCVAAEYAGRGRAVPVSWGVVAHCAVGFGRASRVPPPVCRLAAVRPAASLSSARPHGPLWVQTLLALAGHISYHLPSPCSRVGYDCWIDPHVTTSPQYLRRQVRAIRLPLWRTRRSGFTPLATRLHLPPPLRPAPSSFSAASGLAHPAPPHLVVLARRRSLPQWTLPASARPAAGTRNPEPPPRGYGSATCGPGPGFPVQCPHGAVSWRISAVRHPSALREPQATRVRTVARRPRLATRTALSSSTPAAPRSPACQSMWGQRFAMAGSERCTPRPALPPVCSAS